MGVVVGGLEMSDWELQCNMGLGLGGGSEGGGGRVGGRMVGVGAVGNKIESNIGFILCCQIVRTLIQSFLIHLQKYPRPSLLYPRTGGGGRGEREIYQTCIFILFF